MQSKKKEKSSKDKSSMIISIHARNPCVCKMLTLRLAYMRCVFLIVVFFKSERWGPFPDMLDTVYILSALVTFNTCVHVPSRHAPR